MTLAKKISQLKADSVAGMRVALQWQKMIEEHGEEKATAFYTHLGLNHLEKKSYEWEGLTLSREPTEAEKICLKGIAGAQESAKDSLITLLTKLRTELISDGLNGISKLDPATYHKLILNTPAEFRTSLRDRLMIIHHQGRSLVAAELGRQGKQDDEDEFEELDDLVDLTDARVANDVQSRITAAAARYALLGLAGAALLGAIQTEIQGGSVSYIDRAAGGAANKVINLGRMREMINRRDEIDRFEQSAILDSSTCDPCFEDDGKTASDPEDLPGGPNPDCLGSDLCRCFIVAIAPNG